MRNISVLVNSNCLRYVASTLEFIFVRLTRRNFIDFRESGVLFASRVGA